MSTLIANEPVIVRGPVPLPVRYLLQINSDWTAMVLLREALQSYIGDLLMQQRASWISHVRYNSLGHNVEELAKIVDAIDALAKKEGMWHSADNETQS